MNNNATELVIKERVAKGVVIMGIRRVLIQLILSSSNIILARIMVPEIFGGFAIISFLIMTFGTLTNFGLSTALVQNKRLATTLQLRSIFTILMLASIGFVGMIFFAAPLLNIVYRGELGTNGIFWLRLFSTIMILENLTAISARLLERNLEYKKLTSGEIIISFITQMLVVVFAYFGQGVGSFVLGHLIAGVLSFLLFFYLSPWPIGVHFSLTKLKQFMHFGLNYQANTLIGIVNGAILPVFVGITSGAKVVGLISWAGGVRQVGLAPLEVSQKLIFSAVARSQDKPKFLKTLLERLLELSSMLSFPLLATICALAPSVTTIIYTSQWLPGLTALYLSLIQGVFILYGVVLMDALLALGYAKTVRNITFTWALLQWLLTIPLVFLWDFNGVVLAGLIVSATFFIPLRELRKEVDINIWSPTLPYLWLSMISGVIIFGLSRMVMIDSFFKLVSVGLLGAMTYLVLLFLFRRQAVLDNWYTFQKLVLAKTYAKN